MNLSRRKILGGISAGAMSTLLPKFKHDESNSANLPEELTILFQGDSITDAGRSEAHYYPNQGAGMGNGYVRHVVTDLLGNHPETKMKIYNRGISGNKVHQLSNRWNDDCLMLQPDVLSVLIGVNDFWHTLDWDYDGTLEVYHNDLVKLMERTKKALPNVKLIIGEPFVMHEGHAIVTEKWKGVFEGYQAAAKQVAQDFDAAFIPYQNIFDRALAEAPTSYWCPDGVHPSMAGNFLMAQAWKEAFNSLF